MATDSPRPQQRTRGRIARRRTCYRVISQTGTTTSTSLSPAKSSAFRVTSGKPSATATEAISRSANLLRGWCPAAVTAARTLAVGASCFTPERDRLGGSLGPLQPILSACSLRQVQCRGRTGRQLRHGDGADRDLSRELLGIDPVEIDVDRRVQQPAPQTLRHGAQHPDRRRCRGRGGTVRGRCVGRGGHLAH